MTDTDPSAETTVRDELAALSRIAAALDGLDPTTRKRAIGWLVERYGDRLVPLADYLTDRYDTTPKETT